MKIIKYCALLIFFFGCQSPEKRETEAKETKISEKKKEKPFYNEHDSVFLNFIDKEIITNPEDKKYISDIRKLQTVNLVNCDSMNIHYKDSIAGKQIELQISLRKFKKKNHRIRYKGYEDCKDCKDCDLIDGKTPWGGYYGCPKTEIDKIRFSINGKQIDMKDKFNDVYNFNMCDYDHIKHFNPNPLLKYDKENEVFYLYVKGGNAADTYFGKFIFNENQYLKRFLLEYGQLSETGSFRSSFKGF